MSQNIFTERVYIDPERLIRLKKERKPLKLVPSVFEPPAQSTKVTYTSNSTQELSKEFPSVPTSLKNVNDDYLNVLKMKNANIEFVVSLLPEIKKNQILHFEEGDCINLNSDDKWMVLDGQIKIINFSQYSYTMQEGYLFFLSAETKKKIKQIVCVKPSRLLRINAQAYRDYLKNYLFLKNAEKIKYLKYCPFFIWNDELSEDLAMSMSMINLEKQEIIYKQNSDSNDIFFVKEGVVLLQRNDELQNYVIKDYEAHYEKNQISQKQATLIVKKGMVFGIDGILLKQFDQKNQPSNSNLNGENPESIPINYDRKTKRNTRIYTARTIGKTQVFSLRKEVLETLFNLTDMINVKQIPKQISQKELQKICLEYADMIVKHKSLPKLQKSVARRQIILQKGVEKDDISSKQINAKKMRKQEERIKKQSIVNLVSDKKLKKRGEQKSIVEDYDAIAINEQIYNKLQLGKVNDCSIFAFPTISMRKKMKKTIQTKEESSKGKQIENNIFQWLRSNEHVNIRGSKDERVKNLKGQQEAIIQVKSYRSIISSLV